jgi:hypothetical protein
MSTAMPSKNVSCQFDGISTEISRCRACAARTHVCCVDEKEKREDLDADGGMQRQFRRQRSTTIRNPMQG